MKKENSVFSNAAKKAVQTMMTQQAKSWPPECMTSIIYQPKRPEKPLNIKAEEPGK